MSKPFAWTIKSPVTPTNYIGMRPSEPDKVFDRMVPVQMQLSSTEERKHLLRLTIEFISSGISGSCFRKVVTSIPLYIKWYLRPLLLYLCTFHQDLQIEITDEDDPYIFYSLRMSEEDFSILKSQQGLLIDFSSFPSKFVQLVERCLSEHQTESPKYSTF